jgi:hypothetical protein
VPIRSTVWAITTLLFCTVMHQKPGGTAFNGYFEKCGPDFIFGIHGGYP